jgi:phosphate transport system substrate-binding protein
MNYQYLRVLIILSLLTGNLACTNTPPTDTGKSPSPPLTNTQIPNPQNQATIKIMGAGSIYPAMKMLAEAYQATNPNVSIEFMEKGQSSAGIAALKNNLIAIALTTRPLKKTEDDGTIQYQEFAQDALLVATNPNVTGVQNLTTAQLQDIYAGKLQNWQTLGGPDGEIIVLDRPEDESAKQILREIYLGKDLAITEKAVVIAQESELADNLAITPNAIGTFARSYGTIKNLTVNPLSLNNIAPNPEAVQAGQYKMVRSLGLVTTKNPPPEISKFIDFIMSATGQELLLKQGFVPHNPNVSATSPSPAK